MRGAMEDRYDPCPKCRDDTYRKLYYCPKCVDLPTLMKELEDEIERYKKLVRESELVSQATE